MRRDTDCDKGTPRRYARRVPGWQLFTDDPDERQTFADLQTTLAHRSEPAGPPNRLRHVVRIDALGRRYFLKCFQRTQWKNRLHFATTTPRAADDADRERRVTQALRTAGHGAPRPIAYGRDGAAAYYLCAELDGSSLAERIAAGTVDDGLRDRIARHCGRLLAEGFRLPDLSADHVFATDDGALSVLDLHNGGTARGGTARGGSAPPPRKLLARVLRRFARSVRELPVARAAAMRFATRLLRASGVTLATRRALLTAAQPFGTAARYERGERSRHYAERNPRRTAQERALLERVWPGRPGERVLDLPCGAGRLLPFLRERGHLVAQADGAMAMLRQADEREQRGELLVQADALQMPFGDGAVDGVVMFRFLHHLPPEAARAAIAEACRVAGRFVVLSFFHPISVHHLQRRARQVLGTPATRFAMPLSAVRRAAERHGFRLHASTAQLPFARDLWLAAFVRGAGATST
jgi:SAM-dependent methyltransferase